MTPSGLPLHFDNASMFKERIFLDKADPNILHNVMTTIDHALTRPWTVDKRYRRNADRACNGPSIIAARTTRRSSSATKTISSRTAS